MAIDTEAYGGSCPICQLPLLQKHGAGSHGLWFDACPWCGFAHGTAGDLETGDVRTLEASEVFAAILQHHRCTSVEDLRRTVQALAPSDLALQPTVFQYTDAELAASRFRYPVSPLDDVTRRAVLRASAPS